MIKIQKKNKKILLDNHCYSSSMEHEACGVGLIASTNGEKSRKIVEYGIEALKAVWHRGAVDADGKSGDGAGIKLEISPDFFKKKFYQLVIPMMIQREYVLEWFLCPETILKTRKNAGQ